MVQGNRLLIYSQFTRTLDILQVWLAKRGWPFERLDGTVKSSERQARPALCKRFRICFTSTFCCMIS